MQGVGMETACQACGYQRKPTDQAPDWECPSCGKAYAKTSQDSHGSFSGYTQSSPSESGSRLGEGPAYQERKAGPITRIAIYGSALMTILAVFIIWSSRYMLPGTAVEVVMPWIALTAAYVCRDSLLRELGEYSSSILCISLGLLAAGVGILAISNSLVFEFGRPWLKGILFAIPFGLVCAALVRCLDREVVQQPRWLLWSLLIVVAYVYGGALTALGNRWLDSSSPTVYQVTVIGKRVGATRGSVHYAVKLAPWGPVRSGHNIGVPRSDYDAMEPGRSVVCLAAHPGTFGIAWGQRVPCAG